jgi:hypothetical protein
MGQTSIMSAILPDYPARAQVLALGTTPSVAASAPSLLAVLDDYTAAMHEKCREAYNRAVVGGSRRREDPEVMAYVGIVASRFLSECDMPRFRAAVGGGQAAGRLECESQVSV